MGMTDEKIMDVLTRYERDFASMQEAAKLMDGALPLRLLHAISMIPKMRAFLVQGRREKVFRWLGFLQGIMFCHDIYTVEEMANHNRPPEGSD
jgi:hypothetical protein